MVENDRRLDDVTYLRNQLLIRQSELLNALDRIKELEHFEAEYHELCSTDSVLQDQVIALEDNLERVKKDNADLIKTYKGQVGLVEEMEKLKEELEIVKGTNKLHVEDWGKLNEENTKLRMENAKLRAELQDNREAIKDCLD